MTIFTQDRKKIINCTKISVERNIGGGKAGKYCLLGYMLGEALTAEILAAYPEEKNAMDELEKIYAAFAAGAKFYEIKG